MLYPSSCDVKQAQVLFSIASQLKKRVRPNSELSLSQTAILLPTSLRSDEVADLALPFRIFRKV
jgi:hypothetical protein